MQSKKNLLVVVSAMLFVWFIAGCGESGDVTVHGTGVSSGTASGSSTTLAKNSLSGTVANGVAVANAKVTLETAKGDTKVVGTTDAKGQYSGIDLPDGANFPVILSVTLPNGKDVLRSIIPSLKDNTATANVNPITQAITSQVLPTGTRLANLDVSDGASGFAQKAKTVVQTALGDTVDYAIFASQSMQARTADDPKAGGLADVLIDTMAGMDSTRKPEDILASASDTKDPTIATNLMANPAFQARFAGELVAQGRQASDVETMIQSEATSGANTATLLANTKTFATSFQEMYTSGNAEFTGSDAQKRATLESVVQSAAVAVANIVDKNGATSGDSLTNVVINSMSLVKGPLITIGKTNQGGANLSLIVEATRDQMSSLITSSTMDLTVSGANTATLGTQVKNFGEIVSSAVANSLNSGKDKSGLDDKNKSLVARNIGKGIANSLTNYMSDLAVETSAMTYEQKTSLGKAQNTAKNAATALDSALVKMASDTNGGKLETEVMNSMAQALVTQASETFKTYNLTVDSSAFSSEAGKVLTNMATLVVNNAVAFHSSAATLDTGRQAALTGAMAQQLFNEVKSLDLTGDAPPDTALHVATNMAQAMGPALVEKVGQGSTYLGSNLQILASSAISTATAQLKKTTPLTGAIDSATLSTLQQNAAQSTQTSKTSMEASFKKFEDQGIILADVTAGLKNAGLAGEAMDVVMTQIQSTMASGGDTMKGAARDIAETAANMAQAVLVKEETLAQVQNAVASPLAGPLAQSDSNVLAKTSTQQTAVQDQAKVIVESTNKLPEFIPFLDNPSVEVGHMFTGKLSIKDDQPGKTLTFRIITNGAKGTATITDPKTGAFTYQSKPGVVGPDTFAFVINDGIGETSPIPMTIHVANKLPEFLPPTENIVAQVGQLLQGILPIKNDQTGETLVFKIVSQGSKGKIILTNPATGAFTYQPNPGTSGPDTFTFAVSDGAGETAPIPMTVHVVNNPPSPVADTPTITAGKTWNGTLAVSNADGDTLAYRIVTNGIKGVVTLTNAATGTYTYVPNSGAYGTDTFTFIVNDGIADSQAVTVTVNVDVDVAVSFAESAQRVLDGHTALVAVRLSTPSGKNVTVPYAISGSATVDEDFSVPATGMSVTIPSGQIEVEISIPLFNNSNTEEEETVVLNLGQPINGHVGAIASHTVSIVSVPSVLGGKDARE